MSADGTNVEPRQSDYAEAIGSIGITGLHDSYFWVVNRTTGVSEMKDMLWHWFGAVCALSAGGIVVLFAMNYITGLIL